MEFNHKPVLLDETIKALNIKKDGIYVDGTLGGGGHSKEILKNLDKGLLVGIDQDADAISVAKENLSSFGDKVAIRKSNYADFENVLDELGISKIDGFLLDLGVSSYQLDEGERGFSYNKDAPLDMRMDRERSLTAEYIVNNYSKEKLEEIILKYGEERWAKRIAEFIVDYRKDTKIETTFQLVEIIKNAIPKALREGKHPATKTFQALRIEVNDELGVLENTISRIINRMNTGGRLAIITFHSLEDRIVKEKFKYLEKDCICDPRAPICTCDKVREIKIVTRKPIVPSEEEIETNPRARSSKLRVAEKI